MRAPRRKRGKRFDLKKTMFVLPNLFTLSSIFCGFYAMILMGMGDASATVIKQAAALLCFSLFFDMADGRVARLTKTQSDFGMELDSLADVVSFGVAPAMLAYKFGLYHLGGFGVFMAFMFAGCGAIRLARFNVLAHRKQGSPDFFLGLPIPLGAGVLISIMLANQGHPLTEAGARTWAVVMLIVSYLMVSNIRYRTFKKMKSKRVTMVFFASVAVVFAVLSRVFQPGLAFAMVLAGYVALGLIEEVVFFRSRRLADRLLVGAPVDPQEAPEEHDEEEPADQKLV